MQSRYVGPLDLGIEDTRPHFPTGSQQQPRGRLEAGAGSGSNEFNTIRFTVTSLKGKTFLVWRPLDFAKALQEIDSAMKKRSR